MCLQPVHVQGEPRSVTDPANQPFLEAVVRGECPSELDAGGREPVHVNLLRKGAALSWYPPGLLRVIRWHTEQVKGGTTSRSAQFIRQMLARCWRAILGRSGADSDQAQGAAMPRSASSDAYGDPGQSRLHEQSGAVRSGSHVLSICTQAHRGSACGRHRLPAWSGLRGMFNCAGSRSARYCPEHVVSLAGEDYAAPEKPKYTAFAGRGRTLTGAWQPRPCTSHTDNAWPVQSSLPHCLRPTCYLPHVQHDCILAEAGRAKPMQSLHTRLPTGAGKIRLSLLSKSELDPSKIYYNLPITFLEKHIKS